MNKILIVDDDEMARSAMIENLKDNFSIIEASSGNEAIGIFQKEKPESVLLDLKMPGIDGLTTLQELKKIDPDVPVIINTAHGDIPTAVEAIQMGAYEFIVKPPDYDRLDLILKRASEKYALNKKVEMLSSEVETSLEYLLGKSDPMKKVIKQIQQISYSSFSLIIQGETGTGKSFIARNIHNLSQRARGPFVTVDIGAIPESLVESELFGHEKGAFTGAEKKKKGFFEIADGGTLLIDELQNLSPYVQSKLLAAVEKKSIFPLGNTTPVKTNVRIIGATNTDILNSVKMKDFREDLFYRLSEFIITLPPLKERTDDIPFLSEKFFTEAADDLDKKIIEISDEALNQLTGYSWPGNIRELKNVIRRAVLLSDDEIIKPEHIAFQTAKKDKSREKTEPMTSDKYTGLSLNEIEKTAIIKALQITNGNKAKAASMLQIDYTTLHRKIKKYGI